MVMLCELIHRFKQCNQHDKQYKESTAHWLSFGLISQDVLLELKINLMTQGLKHFFKSQGERK